MTEDELLECPFCGSMPYQEESADDPPWLRIGCDNCEYYIITKDGDFEALKKKWNTRVFPAWLREKIDTEIVRIKNKKIPVESQKDKRKYLAIIKYLRWVLSLTPGEK